MLNRCIQRPVCVTDTILCQDFVRDVVRLTTKEGSTVVFEITEITPASVRGESIEFAFDVSRHIELKHDSETRWKTFLALERTRQASCTMLFLFMPLVIACPGSEYCKPAAVFEEFATLGMGSVEWRRRLGVVSMDGKLTGGVATICHELKFVKNVTTLSSGLRTPERVGVS